MWLNCPMIVDNNTKTHRRNGWDKPECVSKRIRKHRCAVDGQEFRSLHAAFKALKLDDTRVRLLRQELKRTGRLEFSGYSFTLVLR